MPAVQYTDDNLRVLANHAKVARRCAVPSRRMAHRTTVNQGALALYPWMASDEYPGRIKGLLALFQNRVAYVTIRNWRRGTRHTPQWALDLLLSELHKRRAALDHAIALIEAHNKKDHA